MKFSGRILSLLFLLTLLGVVESFKIGNIFNDNFDTCPPNNCEGDISVVVDASSDGLTQQLFQKEKDLIKNNLSSTWNDYTRIYLTWYDKGTTSVNNFGSPYDKDEFDKIIDAIPYDSGTNITKVLQFLSGNSPDTKYQSTIVFISTGTSADILNSKPYADDLKSRGALIFVILGNILTKDILSFLNPTAVVIWDFRDETAQSVVDGVVNNLACASKCSNGGTTTPGTQIFTGFPTLAHTTTPPSHVFTGFPTIAHQTTSPVHGYTSFPPNGHSTIPPSKGPYVPAKADIIFSLAASSTKISIDQFIAQISLFQTDDVLSKSYTHYERFGFVAYSDYPQAVVQLNEVSNRTVVQHMIVNGINQGDGNSLTNLVLGLADKNFLNYTPKTKQKHYIFLDNLDIGDLLTARDEITNLLKNKQVSVYLISFNSLIDQEILSTFQATGTFEWDITDETNSDLIKFISKTIK
uniref:VWFA domain-containing protein n=1 Tax=Strongyloides papillosus TaxID=174720 RepID=A0A0N5B4N6_STREA